MLLLTEQYLYYQGAILDNGNLLINLQTHYLMFIISGDYFYPVVIQPPEFSHEVEQNVSLNRIKYVEQFTQLINVIKGNEIFE